MIINKLRVSSLLLTVTIFLCSVAELILLEIKYQMFSGGFLQSHQLIGAIEVVLFCVLLLAYNSVIYGTGYIIFKLILGRFQKNDSLIAFHFMMTAGIITASALVIQFQLHKYFSDAMNLILIKNIAGGELQNALMYVMEEFVLLLIGCAVLFILYIAIYAVVKGRLLRWAAAEQAVIAKSKQYYSAQVLVVFVITICSTLLVNQYQDVRYNLNKSNAFSLIVASLDKLSDIDGDGFGSFSYPIDFSIFNANNYPGALDIPGNGIDEDNLFGDFKVTNTAAEITSATKFDKHQFAAPLKHIMIIVMESARADVIGKRINGKLVAPNLMKIKQQGKSFQQAYSHTGYTASSLGSLFSGRIGKIKPEQSLYPILDANGFQLAVFSGQDETWGRLDKKLGTKKYADYFYDAQTGVDLRVFPSRLPSSIKLSEETLWQQFKGYSDGLDWQQPQYIYFNMQAGHFPYYHSKMKTEFVAAGIPRSKISIENKDWLHRTYWNAMNHADNYIGEIINELKSKGQWDNTLLIITGDHGEELFDNNHLGHGFYMSEQQTKIPFLTNQKDFDIAEPFGLSEVKNHILNFVFGQKKTTKDQTDENKFVFQLIGPLNNPNRIGLRYGGSQQIIFDLRNMQVMPLGSRRWLTLQAAMANDDIKAQLKTLVLHWENLRWQSHLVSNKPTVNS
ncbi:MAG: sulfatase-like hydrolase/transferase [Gammaproteobacteria bacterium]|nr:sulfatase-like hydrolase/transferase [Gammaproteobacteria bacterium]